MSQTDKNLLEICMPGILCGGLTGVGFVNQMPVSCLFSCLLKCMLSWKVNSIVSDIIVEGKKIGKSRKRVEKIQTLPYNEIDMENYSAVPLGTGC